MFYVKGGLTGGLTDFLKGQNVFLARHKLEALGILTRAVKGTLGLGPNLNIA